MQKQDIGSMNMEQLKEFLTGLGEKPFHGQQIFEWLHQKGVTDFEQMTNLSKPLRQKLAEQAAIAPVILSNQAVSGGVAKHLFQLEDGLFIESVFLEHAYGNTVCVSSQAGCRMGCTFCASAMGGLERNLTPWEMAAQVYAMGQATGKKVTNVVVMGMGEPFDNYNAVMAFLRLLNHKHGLGLGQRNLTVSTCGLCEGITAFAAEGTQINLAVSLHAPNDAIRRSIMPVAKRYPMEELLTVCGDYCKKTNRRITFEYALIPGVNDELAHALELSRKLKPLLCHVNVIPVNEAGRKASAGKHTESRCTAFIETLTKNGVPATRRHTRGDDIEAACGQLKLRHQTQNNQ